MTRLPLIAGFLFVAACSSKENRETPVGTSTPPVAVSIARPISNSSAEINVSGQIEAVQSATISTRLMGFITRIPVKVGDRVVKGQKLVSINSQDMVAKKAQTEAMYAEAKAAFQAAEKDLNRFSSLIKQESASPKEMDNITLQYNSARSRLESARQMRNEVDALLQYSVLKAPFSGIITQKLVDEGSMASPGMPLLTMEKAGALQVSASVPESDINRIKLHEAVQIDVKSNASSFKGIINQISPSSQFTGGQYLVKINIPQSETKGLHTGMYVNVSIPTLVAVSPADSKKSVRIPVSALIHKDQLTGVYTLSGNNTALLRWVRLGRTTGAEVEVISGLSESESYINHAEGKLYNGAPVKITHSTAR